jgi:hypothetical protein
VTAADYDAACPQAGGADCLSHYDPIYDALVYGPTEQSSCAIAGLATFDRAGDWLLLFHDFVPSKAKTVPWTRPSINGRRWVELPTFRGLQNAFWRYAGRLHWGADAERSSPAVNWSEYAELMDATKATPSGTQPPATAALATSVRSGDWVLHFAVSSLSQMGQTLQRAATELQRLQFQSSERAGE